MSVSAPFVLPGTGSLILIDEASSFASGSHTDTCSVIAPLVATGPAVRIPPAPIQYVFAPALIV